MVIGEFTLNTEVMRLDRAGCHVLLEPKVFKLLMYLVNNRDKYSSIQELHDHVWEGRFVSDSAIRKTISMLRKHLSIPGQDTSYIEVAHKRGYKIICKVVLEGPSSTKGNRKNYCILAASIAFFVMCGVIYFHFYNSNNFPEYSIYQQQTDDILTLETGDIFDYAYNEEHDLIAASIATGSKTYYNLYLIKNNSPTFIHMASIGNKPSGMDFNSSGNKLFYYTYEKGNSQLHQLNLDEPYTSIPLVTNFYEIISLSDSNIDNDKIYFTGREHPESPVIAYQLNTNTIKLTTITANLDTNIRDVKIKVNKKGTQAAILKLNVGTTTHQVNIIDLQSKAVVFRKITDYPNYDMDWISNDELLLVDNNITYKLNIKSGQKVIQKHSSERVYPSVDIDKNTRTFISNFTSHEILVENKLPFSDFSARNTIIQPTNQKITGTSNAKQSPLFIEYTQAREHSRIIIKQDNGKTIPISASDEQIQQVFEYYNDKIVLYLANNRLIHLNIETGTKIYLTEPTQKIGGATLSTDGKDVLYTEHLQKNWVVNKFNFDSEERTIILEGYTNIKPFEKGYVLLNTTNDIVILKDGIPFLTQIKAESNYDTPAIFIYDDYVYWTYSPNVVDFIVHQVKISTLEHTKKIFPFSEGSNTMAIDQRKGTMWLSRHKKVTKIVKQHNI